ncbi:MAG TPA: FG-GAP-like repeat-containing protein [Pyrinomonadaceae bacterium]
MRYALQSPIVKATILFLLLFACSAHAHATGALDPTFGTNGRAVTFIGDLAYASAGVLQADGKIVVAGGYAPGGTLRDTVLVRYNPDGSLDTGFGIGGKVFASLSPRDELITSVALQPDGKIVVAGSVQPFDGLTLTDFLVARFTADGGLDTGFGNNGVATVNQGSTDVFNTVAVESNGRIVAAGRTSDGDSAALLGFTSTGQLDGSFGNGGLVLLSFPTIIHESFQSMTLLADGRILVGGRGDSTQDPVAPNIIAEFNPNGSPAAGFSNRVYATGFGGLGQSFDLAVLPGGEIVTVGEGYFRLSSSGAPEYSNYREGNTIVARSDGKVVVGRTAQNDFSLTLMTTGGRWINSALRLAGSDLLIQPDDKTLSISSVASEFVVTRVNAITSQGTRAVDYDNDERADLIVYRPSNRTTYILRSSDNTLLAATAPTDVTRVIPERYNTELIYWEAGATPDTPAYYHLLAPFNSNTASAQWGITGDIPVGGDYYGHQNSQFTVFRPSNGTWYILQDLFLTGFEAVQWGASGDKPVPADYDYDGITDIAVYRPSNGTWYVRRSTDGAMMAQPFGLSTDIPLTGDFDGDGRADFAVYRPSNGTWYLLQTTAGFRSVQFGLATDQPAPGDYDGDGRHDIAVFRQGTWYILGSTRGSYAVQWGAPGDVPVSVRYAY